MSMKLVWLQFFKTRFLLQIKMISFTDGTNWSVYILYGVKPKPNQSGCQIKTTVKNCASLKVFLNVEIMQILELWIFSVRVINVRTMLGYFMCPIIWFRSFFPVLSFFLGFIGWNCDNQTQINPTSTYVGVTW